MRPIFPRIPDHETEAGLTLAEMLLVLAILALAAGLVVGRGLPGQGAVRHAALESYLRNARAHAMLQGAEVALQSDGQQIQGDGAPFRPGRGFLVDLQAPEGTLRFGPDGASNGGTVTILAPDGSAWGAVVTPVTGAVGPLAP